MKYLSTIGRNEDTVTVTYHWNREDPSRFCKKIKSLLPEEGEEEGEPSGPETAAEVVRAMEIAQLTQGVELIQGPWKSPQQIREVLAGLINDSHPEFHQTFAHCNECLC